MMVEAGKILALIPARGGSKGLPNKNILTLNGRPTLDYSINSARACPYISEILVSTDDDRIADIAQKRGCRIIRRPAELAGDQTPMVEVVRHVLEFDENQYDLVVLLQPTSPLREDAMLKKAIGLFIEKQPDCVIGVTETSSKRFSMDEDGFLKSEYEPGLQRQQLKKSYCDSGHVYVFPPKNVFEHSSLFGDRIMPFIVDKICGVDIDTMLDFELAELFLNHYENRFIEVCK